MKERELDLGWNASTWRKGTHCLGAVSWVKQAEVNGGPGQWDVDGKGLGGMGQEIVGISGRDD